MPHAVQMELQAGDASVWATLREDGLVVTSSDLFLKHGVELAGNWFVLGIVDAFPSIPDDGQSLVSNFDAAQIKAEGNDFSNIATIAMHGFAGLIDQIVPFAKLLLGRREHQYGVTPLLIFRQISNQS